MTSAEINALPDRLRSFVHDLETRCDPAGDIRRLRLIEDENRMLRVKIQEHNSEQNDVARVVERYKADIAILEKNNEILKNIGLLAHQMANSIYNLKQGSDWEISKPHLIRLQEEYDALVNTK